ncbi:MAG TPA: dienelactone hydrolase family protein [Planctomycetota bacterium]|nr:dienelactone hydrolase family protein [Planctomycetota bacterium]
MKMLAIALIGGIMAAGSSASAQEKSDLKTQVVEYRHGNVVLEGYLAWDPAVTGKRPGVMVVHEWRGHGEYVRRRAEQLARLGYLAFAADMYGKGVFAKDHEEAGKLAGAFFSDRKLMRDRAAAGLEVLRKHELCDPTRLAAMGYCFGGTTALEMARAGLDLRGVASFHGNLATPHPEDAKNIKAKVIVFHGLDDKFVPEPVVRAFQEEMSNAKVDYVFVGFSGAVHSFTVKEAGDDNSKGMAYNEKADRRSWEMLKIFLKEIFK